jgi:hypothetical protein
MDECMEADMTKDVQWQELYQTAMLELDLSKLEPSIEAARAAILRHMEQRPTTTPDGYVVNDRQQMLDALDNLLTLQRITVESGKARPEQATP